MYWVYEVVYELIRKYLNKEMFVCVFGISLLGFVYIGNFCEIVMIYFVVRVF